MSDRARTLRNGVLCALIFSVSWLISWPVAEMGFNDDWSYIKSAQVFAQTGRVVYNGWATAMLGWQLVWGALFVRLLGFTFTAVKLSTLPIAMCTLVVFHAVQRRFGISHRNALLGALTLGLSPMFLPLASSFMTDVPGLFVVLVCLYFCQRAVSASTDRAAIGWLISAAASNLLGGTARQIAWLGVLVMVPATGWFLRRRRGVLLSSALLWAGSFVVILGCVRWFGRQPYAVPEHIFETKSFHIVDASEPVFLIVGEILCLLLLVFPVLIAWLPEWRKSSLPDLLMIGYILLIWGGYQLFTKWALPWIGNIILWEFDNQRDATGLWNFHDFAIPFAARFAVSLLVEITALLVIAIIRARRRAGATTSFVQEHRDAFWLIVPFTMSYILLIVPRALHADLLDRYVLGLMPFAIVILTLLYQDYVSQNLPRICAVTIAIYGLLAIAGTHDWFAWQRARIEAISEVRAAGVPRTEIQGGFEYDGWTQVENGGHINQPLLEYPPGSFDPHSQVPQVAEECSMAFAMYTPLVQPRYSVVFGPKWCLNQTDFPPVAFRAWIPPFRRSIYVQGIPSAVRDESSSR